mmetsp:Transcript_3429/g.5053  ORF Transcript_3429/g.5053 Transcript_3429/m.5053 type:complete len:119 (-) Transcript_3429:115-471(-)
MTTNSISSSDPHDLSKNKDDMPYEYAFAIEFYEDDDEDKALQLLHKIEDTVFSEQHVVYYILSDIYEGREEYKKSWDYLQKAAKLGHVAAKFIVDAVKSNEKDKLNETQLQYCKLHQK